MTNNSLDNLKFTNTFKKKAADSIKFTIAFRHKEPADILYSLLLEISKLVSESKSSENLDFLTESESTELQYSKTPSVCKYPVEESRWIIYKVCKFENKSDVSNRCRTCTQNSSCKKVACIYDIVNLDN